MQSRTLRQRRSGFTLIELVVVMFILMALAAIVVPIFPNMIERAHRASQASNEADMTKAVQMFQALNGSYPDGYDLLTDGAAIINYLRPMKRSARCFMAKPPANMLVVMSPAPTCSTPAAATSTGEH